MQKLKTPLGLVRFILKGLSNMKLKEISIFVCEFFFGPYSDLKGFFL